MQSAGMEVRKLLRFACFALFSGLCMADDRPLPGIDWLAGHWCSEAGDERIEEYWLPAAGDVALGVGRTIRDGRTTSFEFMRIEAYKKRDALTPPRSR